MLSNKLRVLLGSVLVMLVSVLTQMPSASAKSSDAAPVNLASLWTLGTNALAFLDFQEAGDKPPKDNLSQNFVLVTKIWDGGSTTTIPANALVVTNTNDTGDGSLLGLTPVSFGSTPTGQSVSSAAGVLLATTYQSGNVAIGSTAAGVEVSGRVLTPDGRGLRNATVSIIDDQGNTRTATTGSFGYYSFEDVRVGETYVIGVASKRYRFASRTLRVFDTLTEVDFVGLE